MHECPECKSERLEIYVAVDAAHHIVRTWCPYCKVWWGVKYKPREQRLSERLRREVCVAGTGV